MDPMGILSPHISGGSRRFIARSIAPFLPQMSWDGKWMASWWLFLCFGEEEIGSFFVIFFCWVICWLFVWS